MSETDMQVKVASSSVELELLARIEGFNLDSPPSKLAFSRRLSRENDWEHAYTLRVITEYKRFAFLAMAAGHPVTPSDAVDQAWHLHMIYTESYWKDFCGKTLGKPLHHGPTKGGSQEGAKYFNWYTRTLESYRQWFNEEPPEDIWPTPAERFQHASRFVRVNRADAWVIRKPAVLRRWETLTKGALLRHLTPSRSRILQRVVFALVLLLAAGCSGGWDVFNYSGLEFLQFYFWLVFASFFSAGVWRWLQRLPARSATAEDSPTDPYAMAYLAAGPKRMAESALAELLRKGAVTIGKKGKIQATAYEGGLAYLHPVEAGLLAQFSRHDGKDFSSAQKQLAAMPDSVAENLREAGLILSESAASRIRNAALALALLAPSIGLIKVLIGISRDKPVGFLIFGILVTAALAFGFFGRKPLRTRLGDNVLQQLRNEFAKLRREGALDPDTAQPQGTLATAVGLFGMPILANTLYASEYERLRQSYQGSSGDSGSVGCSSTGSDGSDGGSGCGGGCGGCGS